MLLAERAASVEAVRATPHLFVRTVAVLVVLLFSLTATHALSVVTPVVCPRCPPDCPMHAKKPRCHQAASGAVKQHCHGPGRSGTGLRAERCTGQPDSPMQSEPSVVSIVAGPEPPAVDDHGAIIGDLGDRRDAAPDPPFHPPRPTHPDFAI